MEDFVEVSKTPISNALIKLIGYNLYDVKKEWKVLSYHELMCVNVHLQVSSIMIFNVRRQHINLLVNHTKVTLLVYLPV